jgi:hypothetical protein
VPKKKIRKPDTHTNTTRHAPASSNCALRDASSYEGNVEKDAHMNLGNFFRHLQNVLPLRCAFSTHQRSNCVWRPALCLSHSTLIESTQTLTLSLAPSEIDSTHAFSRSHSDTDSLTFSLNQPKSTTFNSQLNTSTHSLTYLQLQLCPRHILKERRRGEQDR